MSLKSILTKHTPLLGIKLWIVVVASASLLTLLIIACLCITSRCRDRGRKHKPFKTHHSTLPQQHSINMPPSLGKRLLSRRSSADIEMNIANLYPHRHHYWLANDCQGNVMDVESVARNSTHQRYSMQRNSAASVDACCRGNTYSFKEIDVAVNGFSVQNLIGNGDYGAVYRGILLDTTRIAVTLFKGNSYQTDDFVAQPEEIGRARHKNLVNLLGYCSEVGRRVLVYEYVDNGNLHQWLHRCSEKLSPLTWNIRMHIIHGIAKALAYLHEDIKPQIVHCVLKSTNVLLDRQWNPKIADFGIAKLVGPDWNSITDTSMGVAGYLDPAYDSTVGFNASTDVYSFGILVMEIVCGRVPVDHDRPQAYITDWLKFMAADQMIHYAADPKLAEMPSLKELKRIILVALRCVDSDTKHRPTMSDVIRMLEPRDLLLEDDCQIQRGTASCQNYQYENQTVENSGEEDFSTDECENLK